MARPFFRRRKSCPFSAKNAPNIDYKDVRLLQGFMELGWPVTEHAEAVQKRLPRGYKVSESGVIVRA